MGARSASPRARTHGYADVPLRLLHSLHTLHQPLEREGSSCASLLPQSPTPRESPVPLVSLYETRHKQCSRPTTPRPLTADSSAWDVAGRARTPPTPDTPRAVNRLRAECERLALDLREIRARHARESMRMQQLMKRKLAESDVNVRCLAHEFGRSEREATRERSHHERVRDAVNSELRVAKGQLAQAAEVQREALSESEGECAAQRATIAAQKREIRALSLKLQRSEAMREAQAAALQEAVASSAGWRDAEKEWAARLATAETEAAARIGMLKAELGAACEREGALHVACRTLAADVHEARESSLRLWSGQVEEFFARGEQRFRRQLEKMRRTSLGRQEMSPRDHAMIDCLAERMERYGWHSVSINPAERIGRWPFWHQREPRARTAALSLPHLAACQIAAAVCACFRV
ncbi:hypothetical protein EMIHUDRAFT_121524 [Emiliania huxleyi CCMP1516]|uniref:Uncharacterized protein n=3 Tax=Emiliania huxleyi TaxID=2903 RepID=A0A0D3I0Z8_EMIH1|nr:hypothetical protein EMIHUDRAFT_121524 [Emiliania huxleyi CCMP1516]EOD04933.1 hypothetical protein EMIHUDRAFT_121524 [Emiliania huxleyi CCMP1516]|eukprot:XP_005757362.1 hypothetical protein EMIHUDRAFT_121524 [Emiliania huxleyi CCMP1516]